MKEYMHEAAKEARADENKHKKSTSTPWWNQQLQERKEAHERWLISVTDLNRKIYKEKGKHVQIKITKAKNDHCTKTCQEILIIELDIKVEININNRAWKRMKSFNNIIIMQESVSLNWRNGTTGPILNV